MMLDSVSKHRRDDESTSLLPEVRGQGSNYDATTTTGGGQYGHRHHHHRHDQHSHDDNVRQKPSLQRVASLVVSGIAVAVTLGSAVVSYHNRGTIITPGGSDNLNPNGKQPPVRLSEVDISPHDEKSRSSMPSASYLRMGGSEDGRISTGGERVSPGAGGGGAKSEAAALEEQEKEEGDTPPNVIFILVDDLGMNDMGSSSTDMAVATPFIDSLAKDGVRITRYYTNHICTPARVSRCSVESKARKGVQMCTI